MSHHKKLFDRLEAERLYRQLYPQLETILNAFTGWLKEALRPLPLQIVYKSRIKSLSSFLKKAQARYEEQTGLLGCVRDLLGVRLVCSFAEDASDLEEYLQKTLHIVEIERKGAGFSFREFGYDSTHLLVRLPPELEAPFEGGPLLCEIQVRTLLQDAWAEIEHELVYKSKFAPFDLPLKRKMAALNANLSLSDIIFQEIRDYQKKFSAQLEMRQNRMQQQIDALLDSQFFSGAPQALYLEKPQEEGSIDSLLLKALQAHNEGRYEEAAVIYSKLLDKDLEPHARAVVLMHRGAARFCCQQYDDALADYLASERLNANDRVLYYIGALFLIQKQYQSAIEAFSRSLEKNAGQPQAFLGRARACYKLQNLEQAAADCAAALKLAPQMQSALNFKKLLQDKAS